MKNQWDNRYSSTEYIYGKTPNVFFKEQISLLKPGKILLPAEGEGRNAVFAAKLGWDVFAFDSSIEAKKKAEKLALENNFEIKYVVASYEDFEIENTLFDCVALIYAHNLNRQQNHNKMIQFLKPGGKILLEAFSKGQIKNTSGGPQNIDLLFSKDELQNDFNELKEVSIIESDIFLEEGSHHLGKSSIIRLIGVK